MKGTESMPDITRSSDGRTRSEPVALRFASNLRRYRRESALSQSGLGDLAGLHRTEIGMLEQGIRTARVDTLVRIAGALSVSPAALLEGIQWLPKTGKGGKFVISQRTTAKRSGPPPARSRRMSEDRHETAVDIADMPKGVVLAALFNCSPATGHGRMQGLVIGDTIGAPQGEELYRAYGPQFDVLGGRWLQVDLSGDSFDPSRYDERVGTGAAETAIRPLREAGPAAWTIAETSEMGLEGEPITRDEAPGALPNGSTVIKINTLSTYHEDYEEELANTGALDDDRGVILGSDLLPWGEDGRPIPAIVAYYVEWDHEPKVAYPVLATHVEPLDQSRVCR
jgi:transcriptional regulator with XRE-family HTH domain